MKIRAIHVALIAVLFGLGTAAAELWSNEQFKGSEYASIETRPSSLQSQTDEARGLVYDGLEIPEANGPCSSKGLFVLTGTNTCSHGPDPADAALGLVKDTPVDTVSSEILQAYPPKPLLCGGSGVTGKRIQVMYVRASDVPDRFETFLPSFKFWAKRVDDIVSASAAETGGNRHIRFVTTPDADCDLSVLNVVVPPDADGDLTSTKEALDDLGYNSVNRKYMLFVDATHYCGISNTADDSTPGLENQSNFGPTYGRTDSGCWSSYVPAHELMHTLGGVQLDAPNSSGNYHCTDESDRMCYSDAPGFPAMQQICDESHEGLFDCNHDDYFNTDPAPGSYLSTHWNSANNQFLSQSIAAAPNDNFASAAVLVGAGGTEMGTTVGATQESGEPSSAGSRNSIWYSYTPPANGKLSIDTCGSTFNGLPFNTLYVVYTGASVNALTPKIASGNLCGEAIKGLNTSVQAGVTYRIKVDGYAWEVGYVVLNWSFAPANDMFASAQTISGGAGSAAGSTVGATIETGEPATGVGVEHSIWYSFTAPTNGSLSLDTCDSADLDTLMLLYTGSAVNALTTFVGNDNSCGLKSRLLTQVTAGVKYSIKIDAFSGAVGATTLTWSFTPGNDNFESSNALSGVTGVSFGSNIGATEQRGEPVISYGSGASVWYSYVPQLSGELTLETCGSGFDTLLGLYTSTALQSSVLSLATVATDDDSCGNQVSRTTTAVSSGVPYKIMISGFGGATGSIKLAWSLIPTAAVGNATVVEGDGGSVFMIFPVRLSAPSPSPVILSYSTSNGSAQIAVKPDYVAAVSKKLTIPSNKTGGVIKIVINGDGQTELDEVFTVNITSPIGAFISNGTGTGTILNDDASSTPVVRIGDVAVVEGNAGSSTAVFDVTLEQASNGVVSVAWATASDTATAASDFTPASGVLSFPAGVTSKTVSINVISDNVTEFDEEFFVNLPASSGALIGDGSGVGTIISDDASPVTAISIGDVTLFEGDSANHVATFTVTLATPSLTQVSVVYKTSAYNAAALKDYLTTNGTLKIPAGSVTGSISVPIIADGLDEGDEMFQVTLATPRGGATLGRYIGTGKIIDDDSPSAVMSIGEGSVIEGQDGSYAVTVSITLSQPQVVAFSVVVNTSNGSASSLDFTAVVNKLVVIKQGATNATFTITIAGEKIVEGSESFTLAISSPSNGATLGRSTGTYSISNDDS